MNANRSASPADLSDVAIAGLTSFTTIDFPGGLAAVVFLSGCPWRCGYCHNPQLQCRSPVGALTWHDVRALLAGRTGLLDAVVFSGGEPLAEPRLAKLIADVTRLGFRTGLHTAAIYPRRLMEVLPLLDWVGMDIKAPFADYPRVTRVAESGARARAGVTAILESGVAHEFRTTFDAQLLRDVAIEAMAEDLIDIGVRRWVWQSQRDHHGRVTIAPPEHLADRLRNRFDALTIRAS